jgi:hypothetical protein
MMVRRRLIASVAGALLAGCGAPRIADCTGLPACRPFDSDCVATDRRCVSSDLGAPAAWVDIVSVPTSAAIYLDERFIGYSPIRYPIVWSSAASTARLVAVPLYAGQAQQQLLLRLPPVPRRVSFYMTNPPMEASNFGGDAARHAQMRDD